MDKRAFLLVGTVCAKARGVSMLHLKMEISRIVIVEGQRDRRVLVKERLNDGFCSLDQIGKEMRPRDADKWRGGV